jgi:hypothetical protein
MRGKNSERKISPHKLLLRGVKKRKRKIAPQKENNKIIDREADSRHLIGHDGVNLGLMTTMPFCWSYWIYVRHRSYFIKVHGFLKASPFITDEKII